MADKRAIKVETLDRLAEGFQESRGITDKLNIEQMIAFAKEPVGGGENKLAQLIDRSITEITPEDLEGITNIGIYALRGCNKVKKLDIPSNIQKINSHGCSGLSGLTYFNVASLDVLFNSSFSDFSEVPTYYSHNLYVNNEPLVNLVVPATMVGTRQAFRNIDSLQSVEFSAGFNKNIDLGAFIDCPNLTTIIFKQTTPPALNAYAFSGCPINKVIVPMGYANVYKSATNYAKWGDYIEEAAE